MDHIHTPSASGDPPPLLQTFELALAGVLCFALHVIVIVVSASCADEERSREKRGRAGADLLDLWNRVR